ncbi:MAG: tRNA lysidine(34) synthetase TilS [Pseudomonadota bacterium]
MSNAAAVTDAVANLIARFAPSRWRVAFSGGLDSTVLLHALQANAPGHVDALHVAHGLQPEVTSEWTQSVRASAAEMGVAVRILDVAVNVDSDRGIEASARDARYLALADEISNDECLLTAQHADDQAETLLLQLLRGAGPAGLSGMPFSASFGRGRLLRPLLDVRRTDIETYALAHGLQWFDDPSNNDYAFDRNYLRGQVMPVIERRWPAATKTIARAARWQQYASVELDRIGLSDWRHALGISHEVASCERLSRLDERRLGNALRAGCRALGLVAPNQARLASVSQLVRGHSGRGLVAWDGGTVRRYRDQLFFLPPLPEAPEGFTSVWDGQCPLHLPAGLGRLSLSARPEGTVSLRCHFREPAISVIDVDRPRHSFAAWCQERGIPPWARTRIPLLSVDEDLVAIGCHKLAAWPDSLRRSALIWQAKPDLGLSGLTGSGIF